MINLFIRLKQKLTAESKLLFKNSAWVLLSNVIKVLFIFIKSILLTSTLGTTFYGQYISILAFILSIQAFFNLNIGTVMIKFGTQFKVDGKVNELKALLKAAYISAVGSWILSVFSIQLFTYLSHFMLRKEIDLEWNVLAFSLTLGITFVDYISESFLRIHDQFRYVSALTIASSFIDLLVTLAGVYFFSDHFPSLLLVIALGKLISSLFFNLMCILKIKQLVNKPFQSSLSTIKKYYREFFTFTSSNYGSRLLKNLIEQGDVLILAYFSTQSEVGIYGVGKRVGYAVLGFVDPLVNAIFPQFSNLIARKKYKELKQMIRQFSKIIIFPSILLLGIAFFVRNKLIILLYGTEFMASSDIFLIILSAALVATFTFWNISLLISLNEVRYRFKMNVFILLFTIFASGLFVPSYGAIGTAFILLGIKLIESIAGSVKSLKIIQQKIGRYG